MAMQFEQSFVVRAPIEAVWDYLTDPYRAAAALPGAAVTGKIDDQTFAGTITVKVGPVSSKYNGQARFVSLDPVSHTAEIVGTGTDVKGRGGADMKMQSRLLARGPSETEVSVSSEVAVTGVLAQFGRGMIQEVSDQLFKKFTEAARAELEGDAAAGAEASPQGAPAAPSQPAEALDAVALGRAVAGSVAQRWLRQPRFWIALLAMVALLYLWIGR